MESIEVNQPLTPGEPKGMILPEEAQYFLYQSGRWAKFLGIMGFIFTAFILIAALFMGTVFSLMSAYQANPYPAGMGGIVGFAYSLIGVLYLFFSLYLYQFGNTIQTGIGFNDPIVVTKALGKLKSFFKLMGITTIVIIAIYILIIIGFIVAGAAIRGNLA